MEIVNEKDLRPGRWYRTNTEMENIFRWKSFKIRNNEIYLLMRCTSKYFNIPDKKFNVPYYPDRIWFYFEEDQPFRFGK